MSYKLLPLRPNRRPAGDDGRSGQPAYVQYREMDFEFFNRLTAEEGIFYYVNAEGMLILTDDAATLSGRIQLSYNPNKNAQLQEKTVNRFTHSHKVRTSRAVLRDYTFKKPKWKAEFEVGGGYEHYDYPGRFKDARGKQYTGYRLDSLRRDVDIGWGETNSPQLYVGGLLQLTAHPNEEFNRVWQLTSVSYHGEQPQGGKPLELNPGGAVNNEDVNYEGYESNTKETLFIMTHPFIAWDIGKIEKGKDNISTVSHRFASSGNGDNALEYKDINGNSEGTEVNAFRHTLWQATITAKYGSQIAKEVGDSHEENPQILNTNKREFETLSEADQMVDLLNNQIGRKIGGDNKNLNTKELSVAVLESFHNDGLYVVDKSNPGKFIVTKKKITKEKYDYMNETFEKLNEYGKED